ncbi:MAG TPA: GYD domain-containing protein [Thermoanaerobaculia bacterium]|nr:GYD domain-containing protein [Thermoanaerobaculia bacterium]
MPTYISLLRYTPQGVQKIKEGPARLEAAKKAFKTLGKGELKQFYLVLGQYDAVVISEGPDDESAAKVALAIGSQGNVRTETFRAFTEDEFRKLIAALP